MGVAHGHVQGGVVQDFLERLEFTFKHALTHEVTYASLLQERRRSLHLRILHTLGRRHAVQPSDVRRELRMALIPLGRYQDVLAVMHDAERPATRLGDPARLGRVLCDICARLRNVAGDHRQAIEVGQRARVIAAETGDRELEREGQYRTGQAYFAIGDFPQALELLSLCAEGAGDGRGQRSPLFASWSHSWLALTLSSLGGFVDARSHAQEALRIAEGADHPFTLAEALTGVGSVALAQGDLRQAIDALERARALTRARTSSPGLSSLGLGTRTRSPGGRSRPGAFSRRWRETQRR